MPRLHMGIGEDFFLLGKPLGLDFAGGGHPLAYFGGRSSSVGSGELFEFDDWDFDMDVDSV